MKTQRRHELQQNVLADILGRWIVRIRPYWRLMVGGLVLAVAAFLIFRLVTVRREAQLGQSWAEYMEASETQDPDRLRYVAEQYEGSPASLWAWQAVADIHMAQASQLLTTDRRQAFEQLQEAAEAYQRVRQDATDRLLKQRATFGLAQVREAENKLDEAAELYREVQTSWPDSPLADFARRRLANVQDQATRDFYAWYYRQNVQPRDSNGSPSILPGGGLGRLPDQPDLFLPGPLPQSTPPESAEQPGTRRGDELDELDLEQQFPELPLDSPRRPAPASNGDIQPTDLQPDASPAAEPSAIRTESGPNAQGDESEEGHAPASGDGQDGEGPEDATASQDAP